MCEQNIAPGKRKITKQEALNSIYIDFEGEGRSNANPHPKPHMLGAYWPKQGDTKAVYRAYFFDERWQPVKNGTRCEAEIGDFCKVISDLVDEARSRDGYLVHWSQHEETCIQEFCQEECLSFDNILFNAKPPIDKMINSRPDGRAPTSNELKNYMTFFFPKTKQIDEIKPGAAESCRRIDKACDVIKWSQWKEKDKDIVKNLIEYNKSDCRAAWKLTKKLANYLSSNIKAV